MDINIIYGYILIFSLIIMTGVLAYSWSKRVTSVGKAFLTFMAINEMWVFSTVASLISPSAEWADFWLNYFRFFWVAILPVAFLTFVFMYTGRSDWVNPRNVLVLMIIPMVTQVVVWFFNSAFVKAPGAFERVGLFWYENGSEVSGWYFWVHTYYSYLLMGSAIVMLGIHMFKAKYPYKTQAVLLFLGTLIPLFVNMMVIYNILDPSPPDATAQSFAITAVIWAWALFKYRLLDIMPVARDQIIESMEDALMVIDNENRVVDVNPPAVAIINRSKKEIIGKPAWDVLVEWEELLEKFGTLSQADNEISLNLPGGKRDFDLKISSLFGKDKNIPVGRLVVLRDITELKMVVDELEAYAHTVAHDLKTPLSALFGYSEMLEEMFGDTTGLQTVQILQNMQEVSHKMTHIIDELLIMSSLRQDEVKLAEIDMSKIVEAVLSRMESEIKKRNAQVILPDRWPNLMGYSAWIEEVWANYLSNAFKYGGTPPLVEIGVEPDKEGYTRCFVKDNGKGLTDDERGKMFVQFSRVGRSDEEGQGLGLSIVKRIVNRVGGEVGVESEVGQGSKFYFTLKNAKD